MIKVEIRDTVTGEVSVFFGDDALVVVRDGDDVTVAAEGTNTEGAHELAGLCRDFLETQESKETACKTPRGTRSAAAAMH